MKTIVGAVAMAAVSLLISASVALGDDRAPPKDNTLPSWAKVVVNHPASKHGSYYEGISQTAITNRNGSKRDGNGPAAR
ncbi:MULTISPECIES: hypothetical protein [unclassified Ensifer]|uniref:hypothetical protein n=1 Tax=unclassified Ensifer TaxID=2633371 RepID=UPI0030101E53